MPPSLFIIRWVAKYIKKEKVELKARIYAITAKERAYGMCAPARDHTPATLVVFYLKQKESFKEDKVEMFVVLRFTTSIKKVKGYGKPCDILSHQKIITKDNKNSYGWIE